MFGVDVSGLTFAAHPRRRDATAPRPGWRTAASPRPPPVRPPLTFSGSPQESPGHLEWNSTRLEAPTDIRGRPTPHCTRRTGCCHRPGAFTITVGTLYVFAEGRKGPEASKEPSRSTKNVVEYLTAPATTPVIFGWPSCITYSTL